PVEHSEMLDDLHVMNILLKKFSRHIGKIFWNSGQLYIFAPLDFVFNIFASPGGFHLLNHQSNRFAVCVIKRAVSLFLVIVGHLHTKVPAAGMDDDIETSVIISIYFNEVIPSPESSNTSGCPKNI